MLFIRYFARANYLAYVLIAWSLALLEAGVSLLAQPATPLELQGAVLMVLLLISLAWVLAPLVVRSKIDVSPGHAG